MKVLLIDNYDSFTFNLYQYVGEVLVEEGVDFRLVVKRNDDITLEEIKDAGFERIIISPGPGHPADKGYFGVCADVLTEISKVVPVMGVCLGMQGMAHYFGGQVVKAIVPMHGKTSLISHDGEGLFKKLPQKLEVMRYHSLIAEKKSLPNCLKITATVDDSNHEIMGLRHVSFPIEGIQFHPESFATEGGKVIIKNFLDSTNL